MKIVQIQIFTEYTGRAALRLHRAFLKNEINSTIISLHPAKNDDLHVKQKGKWSTKIVKLDNILKSYIVKNTIPRFGPFSYPILGSDISEMDEIKQADIIYVHWALGGFLNLSSFAKLAELGKPVIFFMHDMWNITGGCHHSFSCEKYKSHCYDCQVFSTHKEKDLSYKGFEKKNKFYSEFANLYFISPSKWLYDCAKQSALIKTKPIFHIPNILDHTFYKPLDKATSKKAFNIDINKKVIGFGAMSIDSPFKGWEYLLEALKILYRDSEFSDISVLIFGSGYKKEIDDQIPFKTIFTGHLDDEYSTLLVYNAADVFIAPSLADNLPTTVLESLSCGTPVVGFNVGGIPDMIDHKKNGYLSKYKDAEDITIGIKFCLNNNIKGYNLAQFDTEFIIKQHISLWNQAQNKK